VSITKKFGKNSSIYILNSFLQNAIYVLFLPIYTRYLIPSEYGIVSLTSTIGSWLGTLFSFSLDAAFYRKYFKYKDQENELKIFLGTIFIAVLLLTLIGSGFLLYFGHFIFKIIAKNIPFYPYFILVIITAGFQPFFSLFQTLLQIQNKPWHYSFISIFSLLGRISLTLLFFTKIKTIPACAPLLANMIITIICTIYVFLAFRKRITWRIKINILKDSLAYSLPVLPHTMLVTARPIIDKLILNAFVSISAVGIFNIGFQFGSLIFLIQTGFSNAYIPLLYNSMEDDNKQQLLELRNMGILISMVYLISAIGLSLFSNEIIHIFTAKTYEQSRNIISFVAFAYAIYGIGNIFTNTITFYNKGMRIIPFVTAFSVLLSVALNIYFVKKLGLNGACFAIVINNFIVAILFAVISTHFAGIRWPFLKITVLIGFSILILGSIHEFFTYFNHINFIALILFKVIFLFITIAGLSSIGLGNPFIFVKYMKKIQTQMK
jgi:O-antigen/teichoic acid export membrane protein